MYPRLPILKEPMKAFHQEHTPPYPGDVRPTVDLPAGFDLNTLTDFEVWDGERWRGKDEFNDPDVIEDGTSGKNRTL